MASAWGKSFGITWANAWGTIVTSSGGFGGVNAYISAQQRRKRKKKEREKLRAEIRHLNRWR